MFSNTYVIYVVAGVFIVGFSSILTGLNFIVTIHKMRAPGSLVPPSALHLGELRDRGDPRARDPGARDDARAARRSSGSSVSASSIPRSAAIRCCSSTCSGSTRILPSTSWCCRRWVW
jgi:hypothetical protein